jgi:prephenate dehydrogenase
MVRLGQLVIVGVGLMGGSIGLAARQRGVASRVVGVGRDERNLARARALGAIDDGTTDLPSAVAQADLVVVCTPVDRVAADVLAVAESTPQHCLITDVGSTKVQILQALQAQLQPTGPQFIGSHPLAGSEKRGAAHAKADLLDGRLVVVTPTPNDDTEAIAFIELFWQNLGASVMRMDPHEHDRALARTSHLPHAVASALAAVTPVGWLGLSAGGFRDTTRVAAGDPDLWAAIFSSNRDELRSSLNAVQERLNELTQRLEHNDHAGIVRWLAEGKKVRDALGS